MLRAQAEIPLPPSYHESDITVLQAVAADGLEKSLRHGGPVERDRHADGGGRLIEPPDVFLQAEDPTVIKADSLEDPVTVKQAMVEDRDLGLGFRIKFAVDVDVHSLQIIVRGGGS